MSELPSRLELSVSGGELEFEHRTGCPLANGQRNWSNTLSKKDREAYELADGIIKAICQAEEKNGEMESVYVLSTLSFVAAGICVSSDEPTAKAVEHTVAQLKHHVKILNGIDSIRQEQPKPPMSPEERAARAHGEVLARQILPILGTVDPAVALVALQQSMVEIITACFGPHAVRTAIGCADAVRTLVAEQAEIPGDESEAA
jgi:hypothetical protein